MSRVKEIYMSILESNSYCLPEGVTIADINRMQELEIYNWEEYERTQRQSWNDNFKFENPGEAQKIQQTEQYISQYYQQCFNQEEKGEQ